MALNPTLERELRAAAGEWSEPEQYADWQRRVELAIACVNADVRQLEALQREGITEVTDGVADALWSQRGILHHLVDLRNVIASSRERNVA